LALNRLEEVVQTLGNLPDPPPVERRLQLWSHPAVMAAMVALLTLFWILRKWVGLF
jgi:ferric-dicitrate binding protein FerR (iron transport regulator)